MREESKNDGGIYCHMDDYSGGPMSRLCVWDCSDWNRKQTGKYIGKSEKEFAKKTTLDTAFLSGNGMPMGVTVWGLSGIGYRTNDAGFIRRLAEKRIGILLSPEKEESL